MDRKSIEEKEGRNKNNNQSKLDASVHVLFVSLHSSQLSLPGTVPIFLVEPVGMVELEEGDLGGRELEFRGSVEHPERLVFLREFRLLRVESGDFELW